MLNLFAIAMYAMVAGAEMWVNIADYGRMKHTWLATFLGLTHGSAFHDTFRRVFSLLDPQVLEQCLRQWMATTTPLLPHEVVAIDGKMVRHSFDRGRA